jgi:hypothetical protein
MRHVKDRRAPLATALFPFRDNTDNPKRERRKTSERRMENLNSEERQLLLSEMPSPTPRKPR